MAKKIVICSDGTGNSFDVQVSNVTRLVMFLDLSRPDEQVVLYDQGVGTDPKRVNSVKAYKEEDRKAREALSVLDPPYRSLLAKIAGLAFGYGLRRNVRELYTALADRYQDGDTIYLFGFSRGAFTVRVLAGLLFRCGLLPKGTGCFQSKFEEAYDLYTPHLPDCDRVKQFKLDERVREPCVHFLGLWDTVKSYGGIWPQSLPHLRHNPIVKKVRHALALHEKRSWYLPTSWGGIDSDRPMDDPRYGNQQIQEIWFRGSHSDVGGGYDDGAAANIPLRWMLNEAADARLVLNQSGREFAASEDPQHAALNESLTPCWVIAEYIPRWELDNSYRPPKRFFKCGPSGKRQPAKLSRQRTITMHSSVGAEQNVGAEPNIVMRYVETKVASFE